MEGSASPEQAVLRINNLKGFLAILNAIKPSGAKQLCSVEVGSEGLKIRWEDDSKSLQSSLFIGQQIFAEYNCTWVRRQFTVPFNLLLDTFAVFLSSMSMSELVVKYPNNNQQLIFEMLEERGEATTICTYSQLDTRETAEMRDLADYWEGPVSFFLIPGSLLKEAVEDMEWAAGNGSVNLHMQRDPPSLSLQASGTGELEVKVNVDSLRGFQCGDATVHHAYKFKHLRAMVTNLPQAKDPTAQTTTKVSIDRQGLIKMTHMMSLQGTPRGSGMQSLSIADSQRAAASNAAIVQFMSAADDIMDTD